MMRARPITARKPRRAVLPALGLLLVGLSAGCGGDDSGGGGGGIVTTPCVELANAVDPVPGTVVAVDGLSGDCDELWVDVTISGVGQPLFGVSFDLLFPTNLVALRAPDTSGSVLGSGGVPVEIITDPIPGGTNISLARFSSTAAGVDVSGEHLLIRLKFIRFAGSGSGTVEFANPALFDDAEPPAEIPGVTWNGATIRIIQI
ncbi:MAG TPA: hypothetical protein VD788_10960 [Candidatus Polarisedimenticolaceae bacterium]|nr:hypothetical protein [Candidatus Polarisedimenticolaceae bacterium]